MTVGSTREGTSEAIVPARDGYALSATLYPAASSSRIVVISSATATPQRFYRHLATALTEAGYSVVTYDYRGVGRSRPPRLRGFSARMRDWALLDMAGVLDWVRREYAPQSIHLIGHSFGGQAAGMLDNVGDVAGMVTFSAQSGYWGLQGREQKVAVALHAYLTLPVLAGAVGFVPWSWLGSAEDMPKGVALEWARWCRDPKYLLGDDTLPLDRYLGFSAPVLAYSFADDTWGTAEAVDAMMQAYPNLERRHLEPQAVGLKSLGHFGYFRKASQSLWPSMINWLNASGPEVVRSAG